MQMEESIYGQYLPVLEKIKENIVGRIELYNEQVRKKTGEPVYEHLSARIKSEESMREKCARKGLPETAHSALYEIRDSIGLRIVCGFVDDIYLNIDYIRKFENCRVVEEKDYIRNVKPNGYRSYHMILEVKAPYEDVNGNNPGSFFVEIQLRTIAMDSWASLEHQMKYKKTIRNQKLIVSELKRCADELASCDLSMQTIRDLIRESEADDAIKK